MSMQFIKAGLQSSIQDLGRQGLMHLGISNSGAMDTNAMKLANWLVDKPVDSAVIEITLIGPKIRFEKSMTIAICGAQFDLYLNGNLVFNNETILVNKDDVLEFDQLQHGARAYLAFSAELDLPPLLGSYSTHLTAKFGGYNNRQIRNHDCIEISEGSLTLEKKVPVEHQVTYSGNYLLRCVASVESKKFDIKLSKIFFSQRYEVTPECNRMGIKLSGKPIEFKNKLEIISSGLTQGSIQIPPSGEPIISSVDGQTIGGYPRIANVISADLSLLGQLKSGDRLNFTLVSESFAHKALAANQYFQKKLMR